MKRKKENFPGAGGMVYKMEPTSPEELGGGAIQVLDTGASDWHTQPGFADRRPCV